MFATERITVSLGPSRALAAVLCVAHGLAAAVPWVVSLPFWLAALASATILALGGLSVARDALRWLPSSVVLIECQVDGQGRIELRSGRTEPVRLGADTTVASMAVVMNPVTGAGRSHAVVVTRDACDASDFRRLKVFLRWQMRPETGVAKGSVDRGNEP